MSQFDQGYSLNHDSDSNRTQIVWGDFEQRCSPTLNYWIDEEKDLMNIEWSDWPIDGQLVQSFEQAIDRSGALKWLKKLFENSCSEMRHESILYLNCPGAWYCCPVHIGQAVVDFMAVQFRNIMVELLQKNEQLSKA